MFLQKKIQENRKNLYVNKNTILYGIKNMENKERKLRKIIDRIYLKEFIEMNKSIFLLYLNI